MKNKILALTITLIIAVMSLLSCGYIFGDVAEQGDVTVVIENADGTYNVYKTYLENVENKKEGAKGVLENLRDRENDPLSLEMSNGDYGAFITEIGGLKADNNAHTFVSIYTSLSSDSYEGAPTVQYDGITLYQSGVGVSGMKVQEGTVILFRIESY